MHMQSGRMPVNCSMTTGGDRELDRRFISRAVWTNDRDDIAALDCILSKSVSVVEKRTQNTQPMGGLGVNDGGSGTESATLSS